MADETLGPGRRAVAAGEQPLVAFVSSVMRDELEWAREETVRTLRGFPGVTTWAFEFTPPSSQAADAAYLQKVREADIVIWLVGEDTTEPVSNELAEALAADRRIWVIRLPVTRRADETELLLAEVGQRAKWGDAADLDELRSLLALTFSDEIVRALREKPGLTRLALLEQLARASRERMVVRWRATGLSAGECVAFAEDATLGAPAAELLPTSEQPVKIVVGDVGAGKSVAAERALQAAISEAGRRATAPVPVFMHAREVGSSLERAVLASTDGLGDPRLQGAFVVVDGLDEVPQADAALLLDSARVLVRTFPATRVLLTSRPTAVATADERVDLPLLSEEQALALARRVAGDSADQGLGMRWPQQIDKEVRRPLFAILFALDWREHEWFGPTTGALLARLVERAIERDGLPAAWPILQRLAVLVTGRDGAAVAVEEIGDFAERAVLGDSRLVVEQDGKLGFSLPILAQWFAAESLKAGTPSLNQIAADPRGLDRWRYPLAIALATAPTHFVDALLNQLARQHPAFAAGLVGESLSRWATGGSRGESIGWQEAGTELRNALIAWGEGISPLDELLLPHRPDGRVSPLAVRTRDGRLAMGWHDGTEVEGDVVHLPDNIDWMREVSPAWRFRRYGEWNGEKGWAWIWAHELFRTELSRLVKERALRVDDPGLLDEALWLLARRSGSRAWLSSEEVLLPSLLDRLSTLPRDAVVRLDNRQVDTDLLRARIETLSLSGVTSISMPWPKPDRDFAAGWVWSPYTEEQQLERTRAVYSAAIKAYGALVDAWFSGLRSRMYTASVMPARFVGEYEPPTEGDGWSVPVMSWHWEPLPAGSEAEVVLTFRRRAPFQDWQEQLAATQQRLRELRPEAAGWISTTFTSGIVDVFGPTPVCDIAYKWLEDDLRRIAWFS